MQQGSRYYITVKKGHFDRGGRRGTLIDEVVVAKGVEECQLSCLGRIYAKKELPIGCLDL